MKLKINGEIKTIETPEGGLMRLSDLIKKLGHHPQLIVVEFNGEILTPEKWKARSLKDGDSLEFVTIVGGGS